MGNRVHQVFISIIPIDLIYLFFKHLSSVFYLQQNTEFQNQQVRVICICFYYLQRKKFV